MEEVDRSEFSETPIDIREYYYLLKSWVWLILLAGILAGAAAYLINIHTTPVYEASTHLLVSAPSNIGGFDPSSLITSQTMTSTYSQMLLDRPVLQGVIDQLELQITADELKKSISVDSVTNTQLLVVTVENTDPALAADIANELAAVFTNRIRQLQSQRFAASRDGLAKQVSDMERQITLISGQIADIEQQIVAAATPTVNIEENTAAATQTVEVGEQSAAPTPPLAATPDPAVLVQLQARLTQYLTIYSNLVTSYEQVRLAEAQTSTNVVISEQANIPSIPVRPRTVLNILVSVVTAMLFAVGIVAGRYALDDTIRNPDDIRKKFNLPVLGVINSHRSLEDKPITLTEPRSPTAEVFRSLRTTITLAHIDVPLHRILITSPMPQDGKTTIASNLAIVLAQGEKKTLLLETDLRLPSIQLQFGLHNHAGLTDLLVHPFVGVSDVIQRVNGLAVITSGDLPPNPSELLSSKKMEQILEQLNQIFDMIVIDTPPVLTVTDAAALAPSMDGVVLVAKPGTTKLKALQDSLEKLDAVGARVLGVVLSEANPASRKYGYFYNSYHSNYYNLQAGGRKKNARTPSGQNP